MLKKTITKILIGLNLISPTPTKEVKDNDLLNSTLANELKVTYEKTVKYGLNIDSYWYGKAKEGDYETTLIMKNLKGNEVKIFMNTYKDIYNMEYYKDGEIIKYHYHSIQDLEEDLKLHQKHINENFKNWEKIEEEELRINGLDFTQRARETIVNSILNSEEIAKNGYKFYSQYQEKWVTIENIEDFEKEIETLKDTLLKTYGFDIDKNIDYELILGKDWKCKIQTKEGENLVNEYLKNRENEQ